MIVLDTNVVSELMKETSSPAVIAWLDSQDPDDTWLTAITVFEVRQGLALLPAGRRQRALTAAFEHVLQHDLSNRVLNLDGSAAAEAALIVGRTTALGRPIDIRDALIAGTVASQTVASLVTRNLRHFADAGISLIDPWKSNPT